MNRRAFLAMTLAASAASVAPRSSRATDGLVEVLIDEPIGEIAPEIHGHFVEHLGGVIYDGIWVGENSKIPNVGGIRTEIIDHMQQLNGASARSSNVTVLASPNIHAHNDFENPHAVEPERKPASVTGSSFAWTFRPASLTKLEIDLV